MFAELRTQITGAFIMFAELSTPYDKITFTFIMFAELRTK